MRNWWTTCGADAPPAPVAGSSLPVSCELDTLHIQGQVAPRSWPNSGPNVLRATLLGKRQQLPLPQRHRELRPGPNAELAVGAGEV